MRQDEYHDAETPGWELHQTPTVMTGLVVRWRRTCDRHVPGGLEISASRNGVLISGYMERATHDVDRIISVLREAQRCAASMRHLHVYEYRGRRGGAPDDRSSD